MTKLDHHKPALPADDKTLFTLKWPAFARVFHAALKKRWILLLLILLYVVPFSILKTLEEDGAEIFSSQKSALILEVFSRTDLDQESYLLLEESLRAMENVNEVIALSPEESLRKLASDPKLGVDPGWLVKKSEDLKGKDTILPWSYNLHLARWDENALKNLLGKIESLEVGQSKIKAVAEIHYDRERWSLTFTLYNYVRWLKMALKALLFISFAVLIVLMVRIRNKIRSQADLLGTGAEFLALGCLGGLLSHLAYLAIVSMSFFPESFSWRGQIGHELVFQMALSLLLSSSFFGAWALEKKN